MNIVLQAFRALMKRLEVANLHAFTRDAGKFPSFEFRPEHLVPIASAIARASVQPIRRKGVTFGGGDGGGGGRGGGGGGGGGGAGSWIDRAKALVPAQHLKYKGVEVCRNHVFGLGRPPRGPGHEASACGLAHPPAGSDCLRAWSAAKTKAKGKGKAQN